MTQDTARRCLIIAEAGVNHNGDLDLALRLVRAAAQAGADVVKFQNFRAERLATRQAPKAAYQLQTTDRAESQFQMLKRLELDQAATARLMSACQEEGIEFLSSPFDRRSAAMLHELGMRRFKVPSGEVINLPYLRFLGGLGKPVILSTGMCYLEEVERAVEILRTAGCPEVILLHCVTQYPAPPEEVNLRAMVTMAQATGCPVGYSDHTLGLEVPLAAVALGAVVIEKHFTLDRSLPGPDHRASLEPDELAALVQGIRKVEAALGDGAKRPAPCERDNRRLVRRGLVAARDLPPGHRLREEDLAAKRPAVGLTPDQLEQVLGRRLTRALRTDEPLTQDCLA
jgi:N-acetylneuraminate synthase